MAAETARDVATMANRRNLSLTHHELREVTAIVDQTGDFAPEPEVVSLFADGVLTPGILTFFVPWMWRDRQDDSQVPAEIWRAMFAQTRYTEDMIVRPRPKRSVRAYRGATEVNREGLSWSLDVDQAAYFARSRQAPNITTARVWVANIPAERVFARYLEGWEKEITADVRGLDIRPVEEAHLLPKPRRWRFWAG